MSMDTGPYALMAELLDSVNVGVCLFDAGDHAGGAAREAGLDWDAALRRVDGDPTTLCKLVRTFRRDCADYPKALTEAATAGQPERIRFLAHALRSSAAYIGAMELSRLAGRVDEAARGAHPRMADGLAVELADALTRLLDRLPALFPVAASRDSVDDAPPDDAAPDDAPLDDAPLDDAPLEPMIRRLAERLDTADLHAEDLWSELRGRIAPAHRDFATAFGLLLDDLRYGEASDRLRGFAASLGIVLSSPAERNSEPDSAQRPENIP